jgi:hypothetical protein
MSQHIDLLAARSIAHERERDLQRSLRQRQESATRHRPVPPQPERHRLQDLLARLHLGHAPSH